jgi:hypothetical protein
MALSSALATEIGAATTAAMVNAVMTAADRLRRLVEGDLNNLCIDASSGLSAGAIDDTSLFHAARQWVAVHQKGAISAARVRRLREPATNTVPK